MSSPSDTTSSHEALAQVAARPGAAKALTSILSNNSQLLDECVARAARFGERDAPSTPWRVCKYHDDSTCADQPCSRHAREQIFGLLVFDYLLVNGNRFQHGNSASDPWEPNNLFVAPTMQAQQAVF